MTTQNQHSRSREDHAVTAAAAARPAAVTSSDGTVIGYQSIGSGEGVILIGGALRSARHYLPLARLLARAPLSLVRALMYCLPKSQWQELESLLPTALAENEQIARLDAPTADRFASVTAQVLLLGGTKSPAAITTRALQELHEAIPGSELELLAGLRHTAPEKKAPGAVAGTLSRFLTDSEGSGR